MSVDAFRTLLDEYGTSFASGHTLPPYAVCFEGPKVRLTSEAGDIVEHVSEWKRAAGRLWAPVVLGPERAAIAVALLPTLSTFESAIWPPMERLVEAPSVGAALQSLADMLGRDHPMEALLCRHSATFSNLAPGEPIYEVGPGARGRDEAFETKGALSAMALVKLALAHVDDADPEERLRSLIWAREAMRENPSLSLGIHRLLVAHVVPLARQGTGLWREAALSVLERWIQRLVVRGAFPEALPVLDLLLAYGVAAPRMLALRYDTLLGLGDDEEAERTLARLRALADEEGHLQPPLSRTAQHVDDIRAVALWGVAKLLRETADGKPPFTERRLKKEISPPALDSATAAARSRAYAERAKEILERRATEPKVLPYPLSHGFYLAAVAKLLD